MQPFALDGLADNEAAFELWTSDIVVVSMTRRTDAMPGHALIQVDTRAVDATGKTLHVLPPHQCGVYLAGLTTPTALEETFAYEYEDAARRAVDWLAAQRIIIDLPETPDDPTRGRA